MSRITQLSSSPAPLHDAAGPPDSCECLPSRAVVGARNRAKTFVTTGRLSHPTHAQEARKLSEKPIENIEVVPSSDNTQE